MHQARTANTAEQEPGSQPQAAFGETPSRATVGRQAQPPTLDVAPPATQGLSERCRKANAGGKGKPTAVLAACRPAIEAEPEAADIMVMLARSEIDLGRAAEAQAWAKKALRIKRDLPDAYVLLGGAEQEMGKPPRPGPRIGSIWSLLPPAAMRASCAQFWIALGARKNQPTFLHAGSGADRVVAIHWRLEQQKRLVPSYGAPSPDPASDSVPATAPASGSEPWMAPARRSCRCDRICPGYAREPRLNMRIQFWGVRGSLPVPGPRTERYGGNTSCVEVSSAAGTRIIIDAGTGIRRLGKDLMRADFESGKGAAHILISHTHWDHIQGLPFFAPFYRTGNKLFVYARQRDDQNLRIEDPNLAFVPDEARTVVARVSDILFVVDVATEALGDFLQESRVFEVALGPVLLAVERPHEGVAGLVDGAGLVDVRAVDGEEFPVIVVQGEPVPEGVLDAGFRDYALGDALVVLEHELRV